MKKLYEGVSAITILFFMGLVALGFVAKTKQHKEAVKHKKKYEKKIEKEERKYVQRQEDIKRLNEKEKEKILQETQQKIDEFKNKLKECHQNDHKIIEEWNIYYDNLMEYNRRKGNFDRGNEATASPPYQRAEKKPLRPQGD